MNLRSEKFWQYLKGLGLTYLAVMVFAILGTLDVGSLAGERLLIPLVVAVLVWTAMWSLRYLTQILETRIGFMFGVAVFAATGLRLAVVAFSILIDPLDFFALAIVATGIYMTATGYGRKKPPE